MPTQTLFGIVESKSEARARAKELVKIHGAIREAPEAMEVREGQAAQLAYFIKRSDACQLDLNDKDGMMRTIGLLDDMLDEADCAFMRRHKKWWRKVPKGWLGCKGGDHYYCTKLHPKEISYLREQIADLQAEIEAIQEAVPALKIQLAELAAVAPLPEDIAKHYALTVDGQWAKERK